MVSKETTSLAKDRVPTIAERNRVFGNIIRAMDERDSMLLLGHTNPDEDCFGSLVAFALLARKMKKRVAIYLKTPIPRQFGYLASICEYNSVTVVAGRPLPPDGYSIIAVLDTPKPSMIEMDDAIRSLMNDPSILKMEIDHHLATDAEYSGDEGYRLATNASSTCELIVFLAFKIQKNEEFMIRNGIEELFTRNVVLSILTGIIGDTGMGRYFKTPRERRLYRWVVTAMDGMLAFKTHAGSTNFMSKEQLYEAITALNRDEEECSARIAAFHRSKSRFDYIVLPEAETEALREKYGDETFISVVKSAADELAEKNGTFGMIVYPDENGLLQFRVRRNRSYQGFDLRNILARLSIENGGGHPGAIGFRIPKERAPDPAAHVEDMVDKISAMIGA